MSDFVLRLQPYFYVHIHDSTTNVTTLETGPKTMTIAQHQQLQTPEPQKFIVIPPQQYCLIENPAVLGKDGKVVFDKRRLKERKKRIEQIVNGEITGKATRKAIEAMLAAVMVACVMPALMTTTIHH